MTCYSMTTENEFVWLCTILDVGLHSDLLLGWNIRETKRTVGGLLG